jgi:hypothetical protein
MATLIAWFVQQIGDHDHTSIPCSRSLYNNATMPFAALLSEHVFVSNPSDLSGGNTENQFQRRREAVISALFLLSTRNCDNRLLRTTNVEKGHLRSGLVKW